MTTGQDLMKRYEELSDALINAAKSNQLQFAWGLQEQRLQIQSVLRDTFGTQNRVFDATEQRIQEALNKETAHMDRDQLLQSYLRLRAQAMNPIFSAFEAQINSDLTETRQRCLDMNISQEEIDQAWEEKRRGQ